MRIRHFAGLAVAGLIAVTATLPARAETLADAMVAAYRHSALMDQNRAVLRAADEDVATAISALRPVIQWAASHTYRYVEGGTEQNTSALSLSAQMVLFDFGRSQLAIDIAKETVLATREALVGVEQDVLLGAAQAYFEVWAAREQVALQANSVRVLAQERQAAQDRFDVGEITVTDVSLADAQLAATRASLASAEGDLARAEESYRTATGRAPGRFGTPPAAPKLPESVESARAIAQRTHPTIRQLQRQAAAAELGVAAAVAERNPTVSGSVGLSSQNAPTGFGNNTTTGGASVGVEMSQTIYSGGRLSSVHRKAMAQRDQVRAGLLNGARTVSQAVGTAWSYIDVAQAQIRAIDQQILAAQQAYDGVREEALLGARTTLDVLDAEQSLLSARADRISAQANLQLAHYQLLAAMGLLTVENLQLGIPTYDPSAYYKAVREAPYTSRQGENLDRVLRAIGRD
ncbi:MAG: TolC family outer membrane protein [Paracoccus sp. (in: a-proteobacteria)]|uniref:TolC family outer membrane protein n=1 Tax=Paracoccus sp. TaxID=267 RepID=UPI0026DF9BB8|nr:TolC family outer membrane protein [Paracoccus sp. (in: a-proteobacteria)]MDO5612899.1 TolC family outer membrane protein [Paracoccus sp. (in: a-proteobacteria)]